jgi:deazaflavin-dependent oxidoreductase (nitroreductase family)
MDDHTRAILDQGQTIDLTTTGRRTGRPRRIEIVVHNLDGRLVISGMPIAGRTRAWLHNVADNPSVTLHYKQPGAVADVDGTARVVTDPAERRELLAGVAANWGRTDLETMVEHSPLIVVAVPGYPG